MRALKTLTSKDIHIAVKRNDGVQYLMTRFSFETEDDLFQAIRRVISKGSDKLINTLTSKKVTFESK